MERALGPELVPDVSTLGDAASNSSDGGKATGAQAEEPLLRTPEDHGAVRRKQRAERRARSRETTDT